MRHPLFKVWGHALGRLVLRRDPIACRVEEGWRPPRAQPSRSMADPPRRGAQRLASGGVPGDGAPRRLKAVKCGIVRVQVLAQSELPLLVATFPEKGAAPSNRHVERFAQQQRGDVICLVTWEDQVPIGYVFLRWPGGQGGLTAQALALGCAEIADLSVAEQARGRGAGRKLMEAAEALAAGRGHNLVGLEVTASNPSEDLARVLYHRLGYRDAGFGEFISGYTYWDAAGQPHRDGHLYRYLIKRL
jgi:GNAT superfamily N-acetyltransferase